MQIETSSRWVGSFLGVLVLGCTSIFGSSCANVQYRRLDVAKANQPDQKDKKNYGVPFYEAKPFLLVVNGVDAKGNPTRSVSLVSLPDKTRPYAARTRKGLGKTELVLSLTNGVLTSTTSKQEREEPWAGLVTAAAGAAVVPATIANLRAQALLSESQMMVSLYGPPGLTLSDGTQISCGEVGLRWAEMMTEVVGWILQSRGVGDTSSSMRVRIIGDIDRWNNDVCSSQEVNFTPAGPPEEIIQYNKFRTALKAFKKRSEAVAKAVSAYSALLGCTETAGGDCRLVHYAESHLEHLNRDLGTYLPNESESTVHPFELYEVTYDEDDGNFIGLVRRYPE